MPRPALLTPPAVPDQTPPLMAVNMAALAGLTHWPSAAAVTSDQCRVLVPDAADGTIVRALAAANRRLHIVAVEPDLQRAAHLGAAGATEVHPVTTERFFEVEPRGFAAVVTHPPFELPDDRHAYASRLERILDHLEVTGGGRVVCVAPVSFRDSVARRVARLRSRVLDDLGGAMLAVPDGTLPSRSVVVTVEVAW